MALIVQKYGGTSVGSVERIHLVADRVKRWTDQGHRVVVVLSAMSGETDRLIGLAKQIQERPEPRELDVLLSTGEQVTIALLSMALAAKGCPARSYTGGQVHILTDSAHNKARIRDIDAARVRADLDDAYTDAALNIWLALRNYGAAAASGYRVAAQLLDMDVGTDSLIKPGVHLDRLIGIDDTA